MGNIVGSDRKYGSGILLILLLLGLTSGCAVMERLGGGPTEGMKEPPTSTQADQALQRRTAELEGIEGEAAVGAPLELAQARTLLEEMEYFFREGNFAQVKRLDSTMGKSLDSIGSVLEAGGWPLSKRIAVLEEENSRLRAEASGKESSQRELKEEIRTLKALSGIEIQSLTKRLASVDKERDDAILEVVRNRSRIEGLASMASASAMYAEARVLVDRMDEEAFNLRGRGFLEQAQGYLASGKKELEMGNPGGAAYLFDLVSSIYQEFKNSDSRNLTVAVRRARLHKSASSSSGVVGSLSRGETVKGLMMSSDWFQVRSSSGRIGWVRRSQVH